MILLQVLFLESGDLRNALFMAPQCSEAYQELDIHMSDNHSIITARNLLIAHVILTEPFEPSSLADCQYLWDLWYGFQWNDTIQKRFINNCKRLLANQLTNPSVIPHGTKFNEQLKSILKSWINTASNMTVLMTKEIVNQR